MHHYYNHSDGNGTSFSRQYGYDNYHTYPELVTSVEKKKQLKRRYSYYNALSPFNLCSFVAILILGYYTYLTQSALGEKLTELSSLSKKYDFLEDVHERKHGDLADMYRMFVDMKKNLMSLNKGGQHNTNLSVDEFLDSILKRHNRNHDAQVRLQSEIQEMDRKVLEKRYGPGPILVEVDLNLDGKKYSLVVETAPSHLLPHSVRTFMDMVESRAWEGTRFLSPSSHTGLIIIMDQDDPITNRPKNEHLTKKLLFPEYSPSYPHRSKTFGFGGRPGGPNFYINIDDNADIHGPGGQTGHDLVEEADSCFAKIVKGDDVFNAIKERVRLGHLDCTISRMSVLKR